MIVEVFEAVCRQFRERRLQAQQLVEIVRGIAATGFVAIGQARVAEQYADQGIHLTGR